MSSYKVLFQLSGSIACYKACAAISRLVQEGHEVRVACTPDALRFVGEATLEGLSGSPVFHDTFEAGRAMDHIELARWADVSLLAPATASTMSMLAAGLAPNAVGTLFLAWELKRKPYLVAPAMNVAMWEHPATQAAAERLRGWGVKLIEPGKGRLACGETGAGRMAEPERLFEEVLVAVSK